MPSKLNQWVIEIGIGIAILLLSSAALMLAMQHHPEIPQNHQAALR
ncbi:hypothetical protein [Leptolyngbya ohadii]|nr:hypothetical protein [Leptolyngbya ohadii]